MTPNPLIRWSEWHALLMLSVIGLAWAQQPLALAAGLAGLSFACLFIRCYKTWTPSGALGAANGITLLRVLATLALLIFPTLSVTEIISLAVAVLLLDGLDGWVARRTGMCSEFGGYFDKETDAFFMLVLCLILYRDQHLGGWVLLLGGFRYVFVGTLKLAQPPQPKEHATRLGKCIGVFVLGVLLFCLLPLPTLCTPLALLATLALVYSFALSYKQVFMRTPLLQTLPVNNQADIRQFFDSIADSYCESHGVADTLLNYRIKLIESLLPSTAGGSLLEIGCGTGIHLFALAERYTRAEGIDLSQGMIEQAEHLRKQRPDKPHIRFQVEQAETLACIEDNSMDVVLCVGAFEHMLDKPQVLRQVCRVLQPGGAFICLTPHGGYVWYTRLARWLGLATRHLSTDRFLTEPEWRVALQEAGLHMDRLGYWTFIPRGDMPRLAAAILALLDWLGQRLAWPGLRGGLYCRAIKPRVALTATVSGQPD